MNEMNKAISFIRPPNKDATIRMLTDLGFRDAYATAVGYGIKDCWAALAYVQAQGKGYAARSPGAFVRWMLVNREKLHGWHWKRVAGFLGRFEQIPDWIRRTVQRWLNTTKGEVMPTPEDKVERWQLRKA